MFLEFEIFSFNSFANNFGAINSVNSEQTGKNIPNVNPYGIQNTIEEENINRTDTQGVKSNIFGINFQRNDEYNGFKISDMS